MSNLQLTLDMSQRWLFGKPRYRPPRETIHTAEYDVCEIHDDRTAKEFVHLLTITPGPWVQRECAWDFTGAVASSVSLCSRILAPMPFSPEPFPCRRETRSELGRFVLLDEVPANGESFFLARGFEIVRTHGIVGVVTFSDPVPRRTLSGELVLPGHCGIAFQAHNGVYLGRGTPRTLRLLPNGRVFHERTIQKIRKGERGWKAAAAQLEPFGASVPPEDRAERMEWLSENMRLLSRPIRHSGNHKYAWPLTSDMRRALPASLPYPKHPDKPLL